MSAQNEPARQSLTVLPSSGKVDQLRREMQAETQTDTAAPKPEPVNADATTGAESSDAPKSIQQKLVEGKVIAALQSIYDPEIPVNIYELGLIYAIDVDPENNVKVTMTLTAPACPVAGSMPGEVERKIEAIPEVKSGEVVLVWEPAWDKSRMSEAALLTLGLM